ncbi:MAG: U32 family peptidase C-terminal domain-containing protein, partial [Alphaproteobacteria bacterium]|nr:U32 family peptidase C-terminal domain-containing protein [Alphaproteobacteria bacterium]
NPNDWMPDKYMREIETLQSRGYTVGFLDGNAGPEAQNYDVSASTGKWRYAGLIREVKEGQIIMEVKHKITRGMDLEILLPNRLEPAKITVGDFYDDRTGNLIDAMSSGHLGQAIRIDVASELTEKIKPLCVVRTKIED